jgi:hypothetical protein
MTMYTLLVTKDNGRRVVFSTYATELEAESTARNLRAFMPTPVEVVPVSGKPLRPGTEFRPRLAKAAR